ncbi:DegV family protein [Inediibacterium massiliense]|uniref:DegV family protein n=1 Tax=Inediibacterium massiliense TaxID=1658111 RepID=UPI0006B490FF|nr:DegV family protein [Inediibacterium massiliense]
MEKIAIITDSSCDLPQEWIEKYNIEVLPLRVIYSKKEFRDRVEISPQEVYESLEIETPKTSLPSPEDAKNLFQKLQDEEYTHVLGIFISSGLSGTYNMVKNVANEFKKLTIELMDSKTLSMGLGFLVLEAAKEAYKNSNFEQIIEKTKKILHKSDLFYVLKTLEYLRKGGRIGLVEGTVGEILGIKPIISIDEEGKYYTYKKVRGRKKSIEDIYSIVKEKIKNKRIDIAIMHGDAEEEAKKLLERIKEIGNINEILFSQISPVLGVHTGPGLIGVVTFEI